MAKLERLLRAAVAMRLLSVVGRATAGVARSATFPQSWIAVVLSALRSLAVSRFCKAAAASLLSNLTGGTAVCLATQVYVRVGGGKVVNPIIASGS